MAVTVRICDVVAGPAVMPVRLIVCWPAFSRIVGGVGDRVERGRPG